MALVAVPFGRDTSWTNDGPRYGRVVSGRLLIAQAAVRRLSTTRGTLLYDPDYGLALADLLGSELTPSQERSVPGRIRNELLKDERIEDVTVRLSKVRTGASVSFTVDIEFDTAAGPFSLALGVNDGVLEVIRLPEAAQ